MIRIEARNCETKIAVKNAFDPRTGKTRAEPCEIPEWRRPRSKKRIKPVWSWQSWRGFGPFGSERREKWEISCCLGRGFH